MPPTFVHEVHRGSLLCVLLVRLGTEEVDDENASSRRSAPLLRRGGTRFFHFLLGGTCSAIEGRSVACSTQAGPLENRLAGVPCCVHQGTRQAAYRASSNEVSGRYPPRIDPLEKEKHKVHDDEGRTVKRLGCHGLKYDKYTTVVFSVPWRCRSRVEHCTVQYTFSACSE